MVIQEKDIKVNIIINSEVKISKNLIKKHFPCEHFEENHDELYEGHWDLLIEKSNISRSDFYKFLNDLVKNYNYFELTIDSDEKYIYERFTYNSDDDYIVRSFVPDKYCQEDGKVYLVGVVFHMEEEKINLKELN